MFELRFNERNRQNMCSKCANVPEDSCTLAVGDRVEDFRDLVWMFNRLDDGMRVDCGIEVHYLCYDKIT